MRKKRRIICWLITGTAAIVIISTTLRLINGGSDILVNSIYEDLTVTSDSFESNGAIPIQHTGRGEDISPSLRLSEISEDAKSIAIIMDDLDVPWIGTYNHWVIWNIPVQNVIPEAIPHGPVIETLGGAIQGNGYGKHRYRGPKPPSFTRNAHRYQFHVYVLDCELDLDGNSGKKELLQSMESHVIQYGCLMGTFKHSASEVIRD